MYLTLDAIDQTLSVIAQGAAGTRVVLTYNQPDRVLDDHALRVTSAMRPIAAGFGEPFVTFFTPGEMDAVLLKHGFEEMEHVGRDEARARYFAGYPGVEIAGAQALVSAAVRPSRPGGQPGT
ncbi:MAG: hypothetical protein JO265_13945 [Acidimicrobiia bacterium]|nr:hypothetical protein [Acidimicrobiia bacterium]